MEGDLVIFTTLNDEELAQDFILELLEEGLIISGAIFPNVKTIFKWDGEVTIDEEHRLMLKTTEKHFDKIEQFILKKHPYLAPEVIKIPVSFGRPEFWAAIEAKRKKTK